MSAPPEPGARQGLVLRSTRELLAGSLVLLSALDAWTTKTILEARSGAESNGLAAGVMDGLGITGTCVLRFAIGVGFALAVYVLTIWARPGVQRLIVFGFALAVVAYWGRVVVENLAYLPR